MRSTSSMLVLLLLLAGCDGQPAPKPSAAPATETTTAQGRVVGLVADNGTHAWRGIPYAATTAGENRWRAPRPAPAWSGTREAISYSERCPQLTTLFDRAENLPPGEVIGSEDCLVLDIYAPAGAAGRRLPVMVWIHGGGNVWGHTAPYDGSRLAANEDVVVVAAQYRLGPLGFFAHEALRNGASSALDKAANFATLDLIAALTWVRDNISSFGGDAGRVTVFGESAGGRNVASLLASPLAEGLFHRAIIQSGGFDSVPLAEAEGTEGDLANPAREIAAKFGARSADELRAIPLAELIAAYPARGAFPDLPTVIADGVTLPLTPMRDAFASTDTFNDVPIITGTNRDELKLFMMGNPEYVRRILWMFIVPRDREVYDASAEYMSRLWRVRAVDEPAAAMAGAGHEAVRAYRFDWDGGGRFLMTDLGSLLGAAHAMEIPFVFNSFRLLGKADRFLFEEESAADRERLSRAMGSYWASFARDGVPRADGQPEWPAYSADGGPLLRFDTDDDGGIEVMAGGDGIEAIARDLAGDPRLEPDQRCELIRTISTWRFGAGVQSTLAGAAGCR